MARRSDCGKRSPATPRPQRRKPGFPRLRDAKLIASAMDDFAQAYPDEIPRLLVDFGISTADLSALENKRLVDVLLNLFLAVDPIEDDLEAVRASARFKWLLSLGSWLRYRAEGEDAPPENLPVLLEIDCAFFVRQRWIAELIARWRDEADEARVHALFFGAPRAGVPRYSEAKARWHSDQRVCATVHLLVAQGRSFDYAYREVGHRIHRSPEAVRSLYESRMKKDDHPLLKRLQWGRSSVKKPT